MHVPTKSSATSSTATASSSTAAIFFYFCSFFFFHLLNFVAEVDHKKHRGLYESITIQFVCTESVQQRMVEMGRSGEDGEEQKMAIKFCCSIEL